MKTRAVWSIILLAIDGGRGNGDEFDSGLQLGDLATPFEVKDVTGPNQGITLCYR